MLSFGPSKSVLYQHSVFRAVEDLLPLSLHPAQGLHGLVILLLAGDFVPLHGVDGAESIGKIFGLIPVFLRQILEIGKLREVVLQRPGPFLGILDGRILQQLQLLFVLLV